MVLNLHFLVKTILHFIMVDRVFLIPDEQGRLNQRQLPIRNGPLDELASMPASRFRAVLDYRLQQLHRLQANLHIPEATPD